MGAFRLREVPTIARANERLGRRLLLVDDPDFCGGAEGAATSLRLCERIGLAVGGTGQLEPLLVRRLEKSTNNITTRARRGYRPPSRFSLSGIGGNATPERRVTRRDRNCRFDSCSRSPATRKIVEGALSDRGGEPTVRRNRGVQDGTGTQTQACYRSPDFGNSAFPVVDSKMEILE